MAGPPGERSKSEPGEARAGADTPGEAAAAAPAARVVVIHGIRYEVTPRGLMYCPEPPDRPPAKHPCPDCLGCNWCADSRCDLCRGRS